MPTTINDKLISWASDVEQGTIRQAEKTARLPIVDGHVALMPDAHIGIGATVGSVIPTSGAIIPAAVGVDNKLATQHIERARTLARQLDLGLEDRDLAYFTQGQPEFEAYLADLLWAQAYALGNREQMMDAALGAFFRFVGAGAERRRIN